MLLKSLGKTEETQTSTNHYTMRSRTSHGEVLKIVSIQNTFLLNKF